MQSNDQEVRKEVRVRQKEDDERLEGKTEKNIKNTIHTGGIVLEEYMKNTTNRHLMRCCVRLTVRASKNDAVIEIKIKNQDRIINIHVHFFTEISSKVS